MISFECLWISYVLLWMHVILEHRRLELWFLFQKLQWILTGTVQLMQDSLARDIASLQSKAPLSREQESSADSSLYFVFHETFWKNRQLQQNNNQSQYKLTWGSSHLEAGDLFLEDTESNTWQQLTVEYSFNILFIIFNNLFGPQKCC